MNNSNKRKFIITLAIILLALILVIFKSPGQKNKEAILPTRDAEGLEGYGSMEEFCTELTTSQEFDDSEREDLFYQTCILEYGQ